jgi:hypothetical protein
MVFMNYYFKLSPDRDLMRALIALINTLMQMFIHAVGGVLLAKRETHDPKSL